jgi:lipopolysaccharide transport system permease protein
MAEKMIITAAGIGKHYWRDLWRSRNLLYILAWRDVRVRYKQAFLGVAWAVIRPLLATLFFTLVFHRFARLQAQADIPYALLVFAGFLPWQFFSNAVNEASNSLVAHAGLVSKVYFPRMLVPAGAMLTNLMDFFVTLALLPLLYAWFGHLPPLQVLFLPLFMLLMVMATFGVGLIASALQVRYRDFRFIIPFALQAGLFITPVGFSAHIVPASWRFVYALNPLVGIIDGFRWCLLGEPLDLQTVAISGLVSLVLLGLAVWYFRKRESGFADII